MTTITTPNPITGFLSAFAADTSTCAMPGCATRILLSESLYIDGCGQVCTACAGPSPQWLNTIEPPF